MIQPTMSSSVRTRKERPIGLLVVTTIMVAWLATGTSSASADDVEKTFVDDFLVLDKTIGSKYVDLARAIPAEKYSWRPGEDVRSIGEVLGHIAQTNYGVAQGAGMPLPEGVPGDWSHVTDKERLVSHVEQSFELFHQAAEGARALDLSQPFPGQTRPTLRMLLYAHTEHHGEHLGQLIAYARTVGVAPPWSR